MEIRSGSYVIPILLFSFKFFYVGFFHVSIAVDTMLPGQSLSGKQTLISTGENFALGFFAPGNSQNRYLGIWYNKVSVQTFVWVANRENPITDSLGILKLDDNGNLVVLDGKNSTLWSTNSSLSAIKTTVRLLGSGNLVLFHGDSVLWQSFDHPCDTNLPGMKLGIDLRTGLNRFLTPWKSSDDPFPGNFSFKLDPRGSPEFFILNGLKPFWRSGPWNGKRLSGVPQMNPNFIYNFSFTNNKDEIYFIHSLYNSSIFSRMVLDSSGVVHRLTWFQGKKNWVSFWSAPGDRCDTYGTCGPFATCNINNSTICKCLQGFEPKSPRDWYLEDWSGGCTRRTALSCGKEDGFLQLTGIKLPDTSSAVVDERMTLEDCKFKCLNNCSCAGYANSDINGAGSGCIIWSGNLIDLQEYSNGGQEFYLRLASSELRVNGNKEGSSKRKIEIIVVVSAAAILVVAMLLLVLCFLRNSKRKNNVEGPFVSLVGNKIGEDDAAEKTSEMPLFDFGLIEAATSNFSDKNKLGDGGFGPVYKGKLPSGEEIAVKRLSNSSGQGLAEFENEVKLIAKLQHRNLVRLLGCSIKEEEKLLIYEFMRNKSLDFSLFDKSKNTSLDWQKRFHIILGIARGLLYLHEDSRLRIIHRDLKPSNILLDDDFNPKISDFGMARIFGGNQTEANTIKVAGTFGYMSPEYAMDGNFSVKSDVFSFGVLLLEIVCGKKSNGFYTIDDSSTLLGYAWQLWNKGKGIEFVDPSIIDSCPVWEAVRCIHIGLLCVQEFAGDRPNMSSIVFMLGSEATILPLPKQPAFSKRVNPMETSSSSSNQISSSVNNVTITMVES